MCSAANQQKVWFFLPTAWISEWDFLHYTFHDVKSIWSKDYDYNVHVLLWWFQNQLDPSFPDTVVTRTLRHTSQPIRQVLRFRCQINFTLSQLPFTVVYIFSNSSLVMKLFDGIHMQKILFCFAVIFLLKIILYLIFCSINFSPNFNIFWSLITRQIT